jgi:hypothetical protein
MHFPKAVAVALVLVGGCNLDKPTAPISSYSQVVNHEEFYRKRAPDEVMTSWARQIPGLAGIYRGDDGKMHIMLTDTSVRAAAIATALSNAAQARVSLAADRIVVEQAEFSWLQLRDWYPSFQQLLSMPGAVLTDIDERRGRLKIGVSDLALRSEVISKAREWGIPESAILVEHRGPVKDDSTMSSRRRPVPGSAKAHYLFNGSKTWCTPGINVTRNSVRYVITNHHCGVRGSDTNIVLENDSTRAIAVENFDPPFWAGTGSNGCPVSRDCRRADAALFLYHDSVSYDLGKVLFTGYQSLTTVDNFRLSITQVGMTCPVPGVACDYDNSGGYYSNIVGATSGWGDGLNISTCIDINFSSSLTYLCQMEDSYQSGAGDSGSLVWTPVTPNTYTNIRAWGIHWASNGSFTYYKYFSLIEYVFSDLEGGFPSFTAY